MWRRALVLGAVLLGASPASAQTYGVAVQVSNGKPVPTVAQLQIVLRPGDFVRDVFGWQRADPHCNLAGSAEGAIVFPKPIAALYQNVAAAGGKNFVTLAFNNMNCGQVTNGGSKAFPDTPALRAEFAAYAAAVVRQVPALGGVSVWNELNGSWNGHIPNTTQRLKSYCLLTNAVIAEIRKVDKKIPIAIGATVGWKVDGWFIDMFDKDGCVGKGDPTIWLDVHPYLSGAKNNKTRKTDWQNWAAAVASMRNDGISNPLIATEWGARAAYLWTNKHPNGDYIDTFKSQVFAQGQNWAGATWYEMLYDGRTPHASLFDSDGNLTELGAHYVNDLRN